MSIPNDLRVQSPPPPPPPPPPPQPVHVVKEDENLEGIAGQNRTTPQAILDINPQVRDPDRLLVGDTLNLPDAQVDPAVGKSVDAVIAKDATPQQKNDAYLEVQQYVDQVGGINDQGIVPEALPAQSLELLADAGIPTRIDARVATAVETVIAKDATAQQRIDGYQKLQAYVDDVGGISDQGIVEDALTAQAAQTLFDERIPLRLHPEVIKSVDPLLKPEATTAEKNAAYGAVQDYVDQVGGVGDAGIVADALPGKAMQILATQGRETKFAPEVLDSVDQVIAAGSTDTQKLQAYKTVQAYVDKVGGVSDQGIVAEALPKRSIELLREQGIALNTEVAANASSDDLVIAAQAGKDPQESLKLLGEGYAKADAATRQALLADPDAQQIIRDAAASAIAPLGKSPEGIEGDAVPGLRAAQNLEKLTDGLDPAVATEVLKAALPEFEKYRLNDQGGPMGPEGADKLLTALDRVAGTPGGDAVIKDFALDTGIYDRNSVPNFIANGGTPAYAIAMGIPDDATNGVLQFSQGTLADSVTAYMKETEELNWLVANHGDSMTPEQLQQAIKDYTDSKGPGWEDKLDGMQEQVAQNGIKLQKQIDTLQAAGGYEGTIKELLDDPENQLALSTALGRHPEIATDNSLKQAALYAKVSEGGRKLFGEMGNAYVKANVLPGLQGANPADPASMQRAEAALAKLNNPSLAAAYGVDKARLQEAVGALKQTLPAGVADTEAAATKRLADFNKTMSGIKGFGSDTGIGQLFRGIGVATTSFSFLNSTSRAFNEPGSFANWLKAGSDTFGLSQKTADLLVARGADGTVTKAVGGALAGKIATGLTGVADAALAIKAASEGDYATAALWGASAAGSGLMLASSVGAIGAWGGPVGIALVALAAVGIGLVAKTNESNKHMNQVSADFLQHAGFKPEVATALVDQSGDGHSPMPILVKYAEGKGYDMNNPQQRQQFVDWVNDMPMDKLEHIRDWLHQSIDDFDGDAGKLGSDTTVLMPNKTTYTAGGAVTGPEHGPHTVGEVDAFLQWYEATPLPTA